MSVDEDKIKRYLIQWLSDPKKAEGFFNFYDNFYNQHERNILHYQQSINMIKPHLKGTKVEHLFSLLDKTVELQKSMNHNFKFIFFILRALALRTNNQAEDPIQDPEPYKTEQLVSEKDREVLEWMKKFFENTNGDGKLEF